MFSTFLGEFPYDVKINFQLFLPFWVVFILLIPLIYGFSFPSRNGGVVLNIYLATFFVVPLQKHIFDRCENTPNRIFLQKRERRLLCDEIDLLFPQFSGNTPYVIEIWKWKTKTSNVSVTFFIPLLNNLCPFQ